MIIYKMVKYKVQRKQMSVETKSKDAESMTAMLINISLLFLITQIPVIAVGMVKRKLEDVPRSEEFLHSLYLIDGITKLLLLLCSREEVQTRTGCHGEKYFLLSQKDIIRVG